MHKPNQTKPHYTQTKPNQTALYTNQTKTNFPNKSQAQTNKSSNHNTMSTTTTTVATNDDNILHATLALMEAKKDLCSVQLRIRDTAMATSTARIALEQAMDNERQARFLLPLKRKAEECAIEDLHEAKAGRREAFKERVRAAGLRTTHISITPDELAHLDKTPTHSPTYPPTSP
jgi:hypothetical protein